MVEREYRRKATPAHVFDKARKSTKKKNQTLVDVIAKNTIKKTVPSRQFDDPFCDAYKLGINGDAEFLPIEPPENPMVMMRIPSQNNILAQCIECMVVNIEGTEHYLHYIGPDDDKETINKPEVQAEFRRVNGLMQAPNEEYDLCELRKRLRRDRETFGYSFIEVIRDDSGLIKAFYHVPANLVRATTPDKDPVRVPMTLMRNDVPVKITKEKHFRRFVQMDGSWSKIVYFKEYGDPRDIDYRTGKVGASDDSLKATEILMFREYRTGSLYGLPRWHNQIPSILGSREAEIMNLNFFRDNAIPAMAVLVAGGYLSEDSIEAVADKFIRNRGQDKMNEVLILEAYGDDQAASETGQMPAPKIEMKPLIDERQNDALFQDYDKSCQQKIRCAFRLSPILLGLSDDYSYSTAYSGMVVAESQVFQPERNETDAFFNKFIFGDGVNPPKYWAFRSNPTRVVDADQVSKSLTTLNNVGALTPNDALNVTNQLLNMNIPAIPQVWGNYPMSMTLKLIEQGIPLNGLEDLIDAKKQMEFMQMELDAKKRPDPAKKAALSSTLAAFDKIITAKVE